MQKSRFHVWATNRSNIEVTDHISTDLLYAPETLEPRTDHERKDVKSVISFMINESPDFAIKFIGLNNLAISLAEWRSRLADGFPIPESYRRRGKLELIT